MSFSISVSVSISISIISITITITVTTTATINYYCHLYYVDVCLQALARCHIESRGVGGSVQIAGNLEGFVWAEIIYLMMIISMYYYWYDCYD